MLEDLRKIWRIEDLRKKIIYTFMMLLVFRLVSAIPAPGLEKSWLLENIFTNNKGSQLELLELFNMFTGGALSNMTIMAMGITPYINASIIMQLLTIAIPALERLQNDESGHGREKIARITRYVTVGLAALQAAGIAYSLKAAASSFGLVMIALSMAGGSAFAMWLGERLTEKGVGNGISLLIFVGIVNNLFMAVVNGFAAEAGMKQLIGVVLLLVLCALMTLAVTFVELGERRIPLNISKQTRGRRVYGGQNTRMTLKVVSVGVLPLIFAYSFMAFPGTIIQMIKGEAYQQTWWFRNMNSSAPLYLVITALLIIAFTFFYSSISFDAKKQAEQLQMQGATIPGQRGKNTYQYLKNTVNRLNLFAALFLAVLSTIPGALTPLMRSMNISIPFGASSILIAVSVSLETIRVIQGEMSVRGIQMDMDKGGFM